MKAKNANQVIKKFLKLVLQHNYSSNKPLPFHLLVLHRRHSFSQALALCQLCSLRVQNQIFLKTYYSKSFCFNKQRRVQNQVIFTQVYRGIYTKKSECKTSRTIKLKLPGIDYDMLLLSMLWFCLIVELILAKYMHFTG